MDKMSAKVDRQPSGQGPHGRRGANIQTDVASSRLSATSSNTSTQLKEVVFGLS